jgi:murein DD-endopeptidase MepM/ murein hydrolase activator NlpD
MRTKLKDVSTVIIVNKNQQTRSIQIKTKHLERLNRYLLSVLLVVVCLGLSIFYLQKQNNAKDEENHRLAIQLSKLKISIPAKIQVDNSATAQSYIQSIQSKLQTINNYLKKRGLKGFTTTSTGDGGKAMAPVLSAVEQYAMYNEYLERMVLVTAFTPLGYPHSIDHLTSNFGYRSDPFDASHAEYHPGIDFGGAIGDQVKCTANGKVIWAGWYGGYGNCIRIEHGNHLETLYGHLSKIGVKVGQKVSVGDVIGAVGSTGHSTGAHLHYEVRRDGKPINPINFLTLKS